MFFVHQSSTVLIHKINHKLKKKISSSSARKIKSLQDYQENLQSITNTINLPLLINNFTDFWAMENMRNLR